MIRLISIAACSLMVCAGCAGSVDSKSELLTILQKHCTRDESRINPKPLLRSKLQRLAGRPVDSEQVDELTQRWTYQYPDGEVQMHVIVEAGNSWEGSDPMVFVDFKRLGSL
jgi:hypothetical protein